LIKLLKDRIEKLLTQRDWTRDNLINIILELFQSKMTLPIRIVKVSPYMLVYHIDFHKMLDQDLKECLIFFIGQLPETDTSGHLDYLNAIQTTVIQESLVMSNHMLFFVNTPKSVQVDYKLCLENFVFNTIDDLKFIIQSGTTTKIISKLSDHCPTNVLSPFKYLGPCPPDLFVGRDSLISEIIDGYYNGYAITGGRRIGKTSLLLKIQDEIAKGRKGKFYNRNKEKYEKQEYDCCYVDCINLYSFQDVFNEISRKLNPRYYYEKQKNKIDIREIITRTSALCQKKLILLLDEMDNLMEMADAKDSEAFSFANDLQVAANQGMIKFIICGFRKVSEVIHNSKHPFYNLCQGKVMSVFQKKHITKFIIKAKLIINLQIKNIENVVNVMYKVSGGYPCVVQFIADQLVYKYSGEIITPDTIYKIMHNKETKNFVLETVVMNTTPLERLICILSINFSPITIKSITQKLEDHHIKLDDMEKKIFISLQNLCHNCILHEDEDHFHFVYPLIPRIIKKEMMSSIPRLKKELEQC